MYRLRKIYIILEEHETKKLLLALVILLVFLFSVSACKKNEHPIVGTWITHDGYTMIFHSDGRLTGTTIAPEAEDNWFARTHTVRPY